MFLSSFSSQLLQFGIPVHLRLSAILLSQLALLIVSYGIWTAVAERNASAQGSSPRNLALPGTIFLCAWPFHGASRANYLGWLQDA